MDEMDEMDEMDGVDGDGRVDDGISGFRGGSSADCARGRAAR